MLALAVKTYGTLKLETDEFGKNSHWKLIAEPHIMMRVKRTFPRVKHTRRDISVKNTPEMCRELEWLMDRWPMDMSSEDRHTLEEGSKKFKAREHTVVRLLGGENLPKLLFEMKPIREPRSYQQVAADMVKATGRLLLMDELGLGKSMSAILTLANHDALPSLIATMAHLPAQWEREINKTFPHLNVHIAKTGMPYPINPTPDVIIMSYAKLAKGWGAALAGELRTVIFDEIQELRRLDTQKYIQACFAAKNARYRIGLTATPVYNYGGEIHTIIEVLDPDFLGTRDEFAREWGYYSNGKLCIQDPPAMGTYLREHGMVLRHTRKQVGRELPALSRIEIPIDSDTDLFESLTNDPEQGVIALARSLLDPNTDHTVRFREAGELDWKLRHATGVAKARFVADFVRLLLESEQRVLLFGWHIDVYKIWKERLKKFEPLFYTGQQTTKQKLDVLEQFKSKRLLIMSLRSGAGLDGLQELCSVCVFGELDWSPAVHSQCIGRLFRDGQDTPVMAYFPVSDTGSDPFMADTLMVKQNQSAPIEDPDTPLLTVNADPDRIRSLAEDLLRRKNLLGGSHDT